MTRLWSRATSTALRPAVLVSPCQNAQLTCRSGIGFAAAQNFAKLGLAIVLVDVSSELPAAVEAVRAIPGVGQVEGFKADVSKADDVIELREKVLEIFGEVRPPLVPNTPIPGGRLAGKATAEPGMLPSSAPRRHGSGLKTNKG